MSAVDPFDDNDSVASGSILSTITVSSTASMQDERRSEQLFLSKIQKELRQITLLRERLTVLESATSVTIEAEKGIRKINRSIEHRQREILWAQKALAEVRLAQSISGTDGDVENSNDSDNELEAPRKPAVSTTQTAVSTLQFFKAPENNVAGNKLLATPNRKVPGYKPKSFWQTVSKASFWVGEEARPASNSTDSVSQTQTYTHTPSKPPSWHEEMRMSDLSFGSTNPFMEAFRS